jgi:flagellar hook assembly protein FlgD
MKLLAVAVLAAAFPGSALGAGLVHERTLQPQSSLRALSPGNFELVGLHWRGSGEIKYRTRSLDGHWSAWRLSSDEDALPDRGRETRAMRGWRVGSPLWTGPSTRFQYRAVGRVTQMRALFVRSPKLPVSGKRFELAGAPPIIPRSGWHADEAIRRAAPYYADGIHLAIVHHTAGSNSYTKAQSASIVRAIELYHVQGNGWNDIGYNFLVDKYGQIFEGRYGGITKAVVGAHAQGFNTGSVGIAVIGDYGSTAITPAARAALVSLISWKLDLAHVDPLSSLVRISAGNPRYAAGTPVTLHAISGHRDVYPTSCPGASLYSQLPSIRTAVARSGLPKLYAPTVVGAPGGPVRFTARLSSSAPWTVTVRDDTGTTVASGTGTGARVDWTWDATAAPVQHYAWSISAPQARPATGSIGTAPQPLSLQQLKLTPGIVSPNADGHGDQAKVAYRLSTAASVNVTVQDVSNVPVATIFSGTRAPGKQQLTWDPSALPDGLYRVVITAIAGSKQVQTSARLWIDRTLAAVKTTNKALSPNGDGTLDTTAVSFSLLAPAHVLVRVLRKGQVLATLLDQDEPIGALRLTWDGSKLPDGKYTLVVSATDTLLDVSQSIPMQIDRKPPALRLVSLRSVILRVNEPGRLVLAVNGRWHRLKVRRAGLVHLRVRGVVRGLSAYAVDAAGNRSRVITARR